MCKIRRFGDLYQFFSRDHPDLWTIRALDPILVRESGSDRSSYETPGRTLRGYEIMNMIRKGQLQRGEKGNILAQISFIATLFGVVA
jgi:hypothetical protein